MLNPTKEDITKIPRTDLEEAYEDIWSLLEDAEFALTGVTSASASADWTFVRNIRDRLQAVTS